MSSNHARAYLELFSINLCSVSYYQNFGPHELKYFYNSKKYLNTFMTAFRGGYTWEPDVVVSGCQGVSVRVIGHYWNSLTI